jgi:hypothetical protein
MGMHLEVEAGMMETKERDVIKKCVNLATNLTGKKPLGWQAPLYQFREYTVKVLEEMGFLYGKTSSVSHSSPELLRLITADISLTDHDSTPYFLYAQHPTY